MGAAMGQQTLILTQGDLRRLVSRTDYLRAVENGFRASAEGRAVSPSPLHIEAAAGGLHGKGALLSAGRTYLAVKVNSNFPGNAENGDLPTIQGALFLFDGENGALLAIMDSIELTIMRTAAATALAAKYLARDDVRTLAICGCGAQARAQAAALADVRAFNRAFAWDVDRARAAKFASEMTDSLGFPFTAPGSLEDATRTGDVIVTCTTAREPFLDESHVSPGAFIAAVGADSPTKSEIAPSLMASAEVFADVISQALVMGDAHHAALASADIRGELADLVSGRVAGRRNDEEIIIFDSTGTAIEDVASAAVAYERALGSDVQSVELADA
jgi:alanine dehydrogenase